MRRRRNKLKLKRATRARLGRARKWIKSKKGKRTLAIAGVAAVGLYLLYRTQRPSAGAQVQIAAQLAPADVTAGTPVTVDSYRVIGDRRKEMLYEKAEGSPGATMSFTPSVSGVFTRNFVIEDGQPWAELRAS